MVGKLCYCKSGKSFSNCCEQILANPAKAISCEQIMRARFSAFVINDIDFIKNTYHASCKPELPDLIATANYNWVSLEILASFADKVHYRASYIEGDYLETLDEISTFVYEKNLDNLLQWFYISGEYPEQPLAIKILRNETCPCGSCKKFKRCCALK